MIRRSILAAASCVLAFFGCERKSTISVAGAASPAPKVLSSPPEITSESNSDFRNLVLYVSSSTLAPDGSRTVQAQGLSRGQPVGFDLILGPKWSASEGQPLSLHSGITELRSTGTQSDAFLIALDDAYATQLHPKAMAPTTKLAAITLSGDPAAPDRAPLKIKMFFESNDENAYAEFFINIDLNKHQVEFNEKDQGYRHAIVNALTAH